MMKIKRLSQHYILVAVVLWLIYCVVSLLTPLPESSNQYHFSPLAIGLLQVTVSIFLLIIWTFAVSGWLRFLEFTRTIREGTQKSGFFLITLGLLVMAINLILPSMVRAFYGLFGGDMANPTWVIMDTYVGIFLPLTSFALMYAGSSKLVGRTDQRIPFSSKAITAVIPATLFAIFYIYMIFTNPVREFSSDPAIRPTYFLPDPAIVMTIIVPVVISWIFGLLLALNLEHYSHHTRSINRRALINIYNGILAIVAASILTQALSSLGASRFQDLNLTLILVMIYALLAFITFGFGLIAHGAKRLMRPAEHQSTGGS
jgi:hypothetical protein